MHVEKKKKKHNLISITIKLKNSVVYYFYHRRSNTNLERKASELHGMQAKWENKKKKKVKSPNGENSLNSMTGG